MRTGVNLLKSFGSDERGAVAMIFGIMSIALLFLAGIAVDFNRIVNIRSRVSDAVDSASLAAGKALLDGKLNDQEIVDMAKLYFQENVKSISNGGTIEEPNIKVDRESGSVAIDVNAQVPMTLTRLGGFSKIDVPVASTAVFQQKDIEVGMALDITGSMDHSDDSGKPKLSGLKKAFETFATRLIPEQPNPAHKVRIALAPYSASINLGSYAAAASAGRSKDDCVTENKAGSSDDMPGTFFVADDGRDDLDPTEKLYKNAYGCPSTEITPLSEDRDQLISRVQKFKAEGWTAGHTGVQWAWNMISDKWSWGGSQPDSYDRIKDDKLVKAVVLMTDGIFNTAYHGDKSSKQAISLCNAMKAKGVVVFAVAFSTKAEPADEATLKACATSGSGYYANASDAEELSAIFDNFASKLTELRIAK